MKKIIVIAKNTFRETIRDRILYGILGFAFIFILFTLFLGSISLGEDLQIIRSLGLAGIYLFSIIITIFLGASLIYKEIEKRTLYFVLSKPVSHRDIILGKFIGLFASILLTTALMTSVYLFVIYYKGGGIDYAALRAVLLQIAELGLFVSLSILFSTFSRPLPSTLYAIIVLYIGHSLDLLIQSAQKNSLFVRRLAQTLYYLLPNLEKFNIRNLVIYNAHISWMQIVLPIGYAVLYSAILLSAAVLLFKKRDL